MISEVPERNERLVLMVHDLEIINSSKEPYTLKDIVLQYVDHEGSNKEAQPYSIPVGKIKERQAIAMTNGIDTVVVSWVNISQRIANKPILQPGEVLSGSIIFVLDASKDLMRELKLFRILVKDYMGNETEHEDSTENSWYQSVDKGFALVDAPVLEKEEVICWEGVELGARD